MTNRVSRSSSASEANASRVELAFHRDSVVVVVAAAGLGFVSDAANVPPGRGWVAVLAVADFAAAVASPAATFAVGFFAVDSSEWDKGNK